MSCQFKYPDNSQGFGDSQQSEELSNSPHIICVTPALRAAGVLVTRGVQHLTDRRGYDRYRFTTVYNRGQAQKESIMGGIIILLTPAPLIDPLSA